MFRTTLLLLAFIGANLHAAERKYTADVAKLAAAPAPSQGGILMVGSSIFRKWTSAAEDLAPLPVTNRGFGGSKTGDQLFFFDQIVPSSRAALIMWYCGSNDLNAKSTPDSIIQNTRKWISLTQAALPEVRILIVSIIRSPQKREKGVLAEVDEANKALIELARSTPGVLFADVNPALETTSGEPVMDCYVSDKLHLTPEGYQRMTSVLKPILEKHWKPTANNTSPAKSSAKAGETSGKQEITPLTIKGSEAFVFRKVEGIELRLHVVKPEGWSKGDQRPCLISFFGGGWSSGTPEKSIGWATWAAEHGMIGIAPDYRTRTRFNGAPEDCVADGRAAVRWISEHAGEFGIDPSKLISLGASTGGHVAEWTAIPSAGPGKNDPAPATLPAALVLINPVSDTKEGGYGGPRRFGNQPARALAASVPDQMPAKMPPTIIFHATGDKTVPYANSVALHDKLVAGGNRCELVTFQGLGHSYYSSSFGAEGKEAASKTKADAAAFLTSLGLIAKPKAGTSNEPSPNSRTKNTIQ